MERNYLICSLLGWFCAKEPNLSGSDLKIKIDQVLVDSKFTPLGTEDTDIQLLDETTAELLMIIIGRGHNRKDRRQ